MSYRSEARWSLVVARGGKTVGGNPNLWNDYVAVDFYELPDDLIIRGVELFEHDVS